MLKRKKALIFEEKMEKRLRGRGRGGKRKEAKMRNSGRQKIMWLSKAAIMRVK